MSVPDQTSSKAPVSIGRRIFDWLSGFGLATSLLLLLGILTWLATLEQRDSGLYATLNKYFDWKSLYILPEINGKMVPIPLPGGYWVCALLTVNLALGGILRIRKGLKQIPNIISHSCIIILLVGGGVTHHFSERGNLAVGEGETSNVAEDYFEYVVEATEVIDNKPMVIHVIRGKQIDDLNDKVRLFKFPDLPFDLEIAGYLENAQPIATTERAPDHGELISDGYYLQTKPAEKNAEANTAACYVRVVERDGTKGGPIILAGASFHPFTLRHGDRIFTLDMRKRLWVMPFDLTLNKFTAEFYDGTSRPKKFVSQVTRTENNLKADATIQMNEPLRYQGLTFFQASYGPPGAGPGQKLYSVFEVVKNPADKWPEYSLWVVVVGLLLQFVLKLVLFIISRFSHEKSA
ncbi:MAG: cytochrome c biogenesis protein ResB [Verrucomicrobiales bacterium]